MIGSCGFSSLEIIQKSPRHKLVIPPPTSLFTTLPLTSCLMSYYIIQADFELLILSQPLECWDFRCVSLQIFCSLGSRYFEGYL